ncbi:MAG: YraN family protein [Chloroflexota bacterium]
MRRKDLGARGEKAAQDLLKKRGYKVLEANYRTREGEIDLVALKDDAVVFVEVRARRGHAFGTPQESVTPRKLARLRSLALEYLATHPHLPSRARIEVVAVDMDPQGRVLNLEVIEDTGG